MQKLVFVLFCAAGTLLMMHCVDASYVRGTKGENGGGLVLALLVCSGLLYIALLLGAIELLADRLQGKLAALVLALTGIALFSARIYAMAKGSKAYRRVSSIIILSLLLAVSSFLLVFDVLYLFNA